MTVRLFLVAAFAGALLTFGTHAQQPAKPGPEMDHLKKCEGTWETTMKMAGQESKGTSVQKMDLGGLWLTSTFESDFGGMKFSGRGFDSYDNAKKKYIGVWIDSMSTTPMMMEGTYDAAKKMRTMIGTGADEQGKPTKHRMTTEMPDDNTMVFTMYEFESKEPAFMIVYKRKK